MVRFLSKCRWEAGTHPVTGEPTRCLVFTGARSSGGASFDHKNNKRRTKNKAQYGSFWCKGKTVRAHKFYAVAVLGLRPGPGDELDHGCYNTRCVSCLECVPRQVNQDRIRRRCGRGKRNAPGKHTASTPEVPAGILYLDGKELGTIISIDLSGPE